MDRSVDEGIDAATEAASYHWARLAAIGLDGILWAK
jgi:hypothetical protein